MITRTTTLYVLKRDDGQYLRLTGSSLPEWVPVMVDDLAVAVGFVTAFKRPDVNIWRWAGRTAAVDFKWVKWTVSEEEESWLQNQE